MASKTVYCFVLLHFVGVTKAANILWLAGLASPSHQIWGGALQKALTLNGHNLTVLSVDVNESDRAFHPNLTYIHMENVYDFYSRSPSNLTNMVNDGPLDTIGALARFRVDGCVPALHSKGAAQLMEYPGDFKFDLVVHDFVGTQCLLGFVRRFQHPPLVSVSASTCPVAISAVSGNPQYPSIVPANHITYGQNMTWYQKLHNFVLYAYDNFMRTYYMIPEQNSMASEFFGGEDINVGHIARSSMVVLINLPPYDVLQPLYQNVIPVAGLHIAQPKQLDEKLEEFIQGAKDGVVYFALGTNIHSDFFSPERAKYFAEAFKRFPSHRFLWKFDSKVLNFTLPSNVMTMKWLPQNDILAHPKTVAFIGHGGALSCHEAVWYGVPQLLIPFVIDQRQNSARAVERGHAIKLDHDKLSISVIEQSLKKLLYDKSYKENVLSYSKAFHDQPMKPLDRAIFWIEYVLRNKNNFKLRSPGQEKGGTFESLSLDIVLAILLCILLQSIMFIYCTGVKRTK